MSIAAAGACGRSAGGALNCMLVSPTTQGGHALTRLRPSGDGSPSARPEPAPERSARVPNPDDRGIRKVSQVMANTPNGGKLAPLVGGGRPPASTASSVPSPSRRATTAWR